MTAILKRSEIGGYYVPQAHIIYGNKDFGQGAISMIMFMSGKFFSNLQELEKTLCSSKTFMQHSYANMTSKVFVSDEEFVKVKEAIFGSLQIIKKVKIAKPPINLVKKKFPSIEKLIKRINDVQEMVVIPKHTKKFIFLNNEVSYFASIFAGKDLIVGQQSIFKIMLNKARLEDNVLEPHSPIFVLSSYIAQVARWIHAEPVTKKNLIKHKNSNQS